jgi:hypothetical protein
MENAQNAEFMGFGGVVPRDCRIWLLSIDLPANAPAALDIRFTLSW